MAWHSASPAEVAGYWNAPLAGYSESEARGVLARVGPNRLASQKPPSLWSRFVDQISDFTVLALLGAAAIAGGLAYFYPTAGAPFLERYGDSLAILAIVVLNAVLGLAQQAKAERALDALKDMTAPTARVIRGGRTVDLPAGDLVPGDVILVEAGDRIAADIRLTTAHDLEVDEGALTGESMAVGKDPDISLPRETPLAERRTMVFMGTRVANGRGRGIVTNTGMHTELGAIAGMLARVEPEPTPLEKKLELFGKQVVMGCVAISVIVFIAGMVFGHQSARELFLVAVALAVAAIPEGLPAVTTIVLALGTTRMAARNALVRRLPAVETLGSAEVVCTDKTGTLTQNAMTVRRLWVGGKEWAVSGGPRDAVGAIALEPAAGDVNSVDEDLALALSAAAHAVGAKLEPLDGNQLDVSGDPTDAALLTLAWKGDVRTHGKVSSERPFTSERRMASVITIDDRGKRRAWVRGAPEALLTAARRYRKAGQTIPLDDAAQDAIARESAAWAGRALRVVALGYRDLDGESDESEQELTFVALVGINDPPRPEVKAAIAEARRAGIQTIMITGDHPATARAIANEIGLWQEGDTLITGAEIEDMEQQRLEREVDHLRVVARATAAHKLRVVEALKARGIICAMTGDGVNDAPAVKAAHIGVAMGRTGTDVTKEAAALVLADDNYATIIAAVEEGRAIYANIQKFIFFLLSSNAGAVILVLGASLAGWDAPLAPIQILWINLITNGLPALALGIDPRDPEQMQMRPREAGGAIMSAREYLEMTGVGAVMAATAGWAFYHVRHDGAPDALAHARTVCFAILAVGPLFHSFNCRSKTRSIFSIGLFTNKALWGAVLIGIGLQAMAIYIPGLRPFFRTARPTGEELAWISVMSIAPVILGELVKLIRGGAPKKA